MVLGLISCKENAGTEKETIKTDEQANTTLLNPPNQSQDAATATPLAITASWNGIKKMTEADFAKTLPIASVLTVVDFSAEWCGPCKRQYPILASIAKQMEGKVNFANIDVDENPNIAQQLGITSIPLLVFYKNGKIVHKVVGLQPEADLISTISEHL